MTLRLAGRYRDAFWVEFRRCGSAAEAARRVGMSPSLGRRWVRESGGVIRIRVAGSGHRLSYEERELIEEWSTQGRSHAEIAAVLGRARSTIWRELARNTRVRRDWAGQPRRVAYRARIAQVHTETRARRPKPTKLSTNLLLAKMVQAMVGGPSRMSPRQVSHRLQRSFADDESMQISHETIYSELYIQGRGSLRADLHRQLRTGRARRAPRHEARRPRVPGELLIAHRPKDVDGRTVPGHWEGDLIIGSNSTAIGTLVERYTRFVMLLHLPHRHDAASVADAIAAQISRLPQHLARSLTWDQGTELVGSHQRVRTETGLTVWFCDPGSPWQRGSNENTNGLLRQYFPKGTDLSVHSEADLQEAADGLNNRPRQTLGWQTPSEALDEVLSQAPVAFTP